MWFNFVKIITPVLCLNKFWKIYGTFLSIWSMFRKKFELHKCCRLFCRIQSCSRCCLSKCFILNNWLHEVVCNLQDRLLSILHVWSNFSEFKCYLCAELFISYQTMIYLLYELTKTYFVKIIKLSCEVNHVVLCSKTC